MIYATYILSKIDKEKELSFTPQVASGILGICSFVGAFVSIALLRMLGKRTIAISGFILVGVFHFFTAISYTTEFMEGTLIGMSLFVVVWQANLGGIYFQILCEVLPGAAIGFSNLIYLSFACAISFLGPYVIDNLQIDTLFYYMAGV
jgi:hypothetical protein